MPSKNLRSGKEVVSEVEKKYGLKGNSKLKLGADSLMLNGLNGKKTMKPPSLYNWALHFGWLNEFFERKKFCEKYGKPLIQDEITALRGYYTTKFNNRYLPQLRNKYKDNFFIYATPAEKLDKDKKTGQLMKVRWRDETSHSSLIVSVLPIEAEWVQREYDLNDNDLENLAPKVLWVIARLTNIGKIREPKRMNRAVSQWLPFVPEMQCILDGNKLKQSWYVKQLPIK